MIQPLAIPVPVAFSGDSQFARELRDQLPRIARSSISVVIEGEPGTGKGALARAIHAHSPRASRPYQVVDCASIPEPLFVRELFGHVRGAFTGAEAAATGRLRAADGGTVHLDGIEHLDGRAQVALLRVLEEGEVLPLGDTRPVPIDLRFVETAQAPLRELVGSGKFRADLYHRLNGISLRIPPLRERREDLAFHLEQVVLQEARLQRRRCPRLTRELRGALLEYDWPGNLLQLTSVVHGLLALSGDETIGIEDLSADLRGELLDGKPARTGSETYSIPAQLSFEEQVRMFERILLERAWRSCRGDRRQLEARLRLAPHQIKYLQKRLGLRLDADDTPAE